MSATYAPADANTLYLANVEIACAKATGRMPEQWAQDVISHAKAAEYARRAAREVDARAAIAKAMRLNARRIDCPTCGASAGDRCVSATGHKTADHRRRYLVANAATLR